VVPDSRDASLPKESVFERVMGSPITAGAAAIVSASNEAAIVSASVGLPIVALLPVLADTLANGRHRKRVETALANIDQVLREHASRLNDLTDQQFKLVNEIVLAILHTVDDPKIEYLKRAVTGALASHDIEPQTAVVLSRVLRDLSADEAAFIVLHFDKGWVSVVAEINPGIPGGLQVRKDTHDDLIVSGLVSLGLLVSAGATWDDSGRFRWSGIVVKLLVLLRGG